MANCTEIVYSLFQTAAKVCCTSVINFSGASRRPGASGKTEGNSLRLRDGGESDESGALRARHVVESFRARDRIRLPRSGAAGGGGEESDRRQIRENPQCVLCKRPHGRAALLGDAL